MILVDTGPLVALCDPRDSLHRRAVRDLERLDRRRLVVCVPVLTEAVFLLEQSFLRERLRRLLLDLRMQPLESGDEAGRWRAVFDWLQRYEHHDPDWADGYLVVASGEPRARAKVWTYDREFRTTWRRPDGARVPLAID